MTLRPRTRLILAAGLVLALLACAVVYNRLRIYNGKWGFINAQGQLVVAPRYEAVKKFSEGLVPVCIRLDHSYDPEGTGRWGYVDTKGRLVIPARFERAELFHNGFAPVQCDGKWGFINPKGTLVIPCRYDGVFPFAEGRAPVNIGGNYKDGRTTKGKWGLIDERGNTILEPRYDVLFGLSDGRAQFREGCQWKDLRPIGGHCGFVDRDGHVAVPAKWDDAHGFGDGLATVCAGMDWDAKPYRSGGWGCIDKEGNLVIPCQFQLPLDFTDGYAVVKRLTDPQHVGLIGKSGVFTIPPQFNAVTRLGNGLYAVVGPSEILNGPPQSGTWGIYRANGAQLFAPQFTGIRVVPPISDFAYLTCYKPGRNQPLYLDPDGNVLSQPPATFTQGRQFLGFRSNPAGGVFTTNLAGATLGAADFVADYKSFSEGLAPIRTKTLFEMIHY